MKSRKNFFFLLTKYLLACLISLVVVIPFAVIVNNSLKSKKEASQMNLVFPFKIHWENYRTAIERGKLGVSFGNSVLYSVMATAISTMAGTMSAFVLSRRKSRMTQILYFFLILGIMLPMNLIALIRVMQILHLMNTRIGIILVYSAMNTPFGVFVLYGFIGTIPGELNEAAIIDGATPWHLFFQIIFPLLRPALTTVAVLTFMGIWNDFMVPLYVLNRASLWPMTLAVYNFFGLYQQEWHLVFADIVLICLPIFLVYFLSQRYIVSGMIAGAVKQ
ncbi:MAG: carbohydrate ABC transporter permease [Candidatus Caldatribacteriaceae bacterium]